MTLEAAREESEELLSAALDSIGISLEQIRQEPGDAFEMRLPDDRKIPYSLRAKNVLVWAREEMRRLGDNHLGTEHVLLGVLRDKHGMSVRILAGLEVSAAEIEHRLNQLRCETPTG